MSPPRLLHFSPLGTKLYFHVHSSRKNSLVLTPNMAALSRGCKQRYKLRACKRKLRYLCYLTPLFCMPTLICWYAHVPDILYLWVPCIEKPVNYWDSFKNALAIHRLLCITSEIICTDLFCFHVCRSLCRSVCLSVCVSVGLSVCVLVGLSVYLPVCLSVCLWVARSVCMIYSCCSVRLSFAIAQNHTFSTLCIVTLPTHIRCFLCHLNHPFGCESI